MRVCATVSEILYNRRMLLCDRMNVNVTVRMLFVTGRMLSSDGKNVGVWQDKCYHVSREEWHRVTERMLACGRAGVMV